MKYITGFFMAWGCFTTIPCPYKKWDESARKEMLLALPLIGGIIGFIWFLVFKLLAAYGIGAGLSAAVFIITPGLLYGFIHTDGYMDCCDAIFSRRSLPERQRILKDSSVGAFAVIGIVILFLLCYGSALDFFRASNIDSSSAFCQNTFGGVCLWYCVIGGQLAKVMVALLICIPIVTRACSALAIWHIKPISHSQYNQERSSQGSEQNASQTCCQDNSQAGIKKQSDRQCNCQDNHQNNHQARIQNNQRNTHSQDNTKKAIYTLLLCLLIMVAVATPTILGMQRGDLQAGFLGTIVLVIELAAYVVACTSAVKNLGGISGDISGFAITIAEATAIVTMGLLA